ncbi:MAG: ABC transporter ATP-binding protein [Desulfarculus sp.]|nr:ABC transporter ATP-binding protein [Desulfarculus sp.]
MDLVSVEGAGKTYRLGEVEIAALWDINLSVKEGAFACLVGPSGSGKTTLLNLIGCLDQPSSGRVLVTGQDTSRLGRREAAIFRGQNLGFVFQGFNLLPVLTVYENVEYPLLMVKRLPKVQRSEAVARVLEAVGISDQRDKYPDQLSGGQRQRVAVARALVGSPALVLADEPTANLDHATAGMVIALMRQMRDQLGTTFIFSTHDPRIVEQAETLFTLSDGRLVDTKAGLAGGQEVGHA